MPGVAGRWATVAGARTRRRRGAAAARRGPDRLELERERVDAAPELVDPALKLSRLATEVVEARAQSRDAPLDLGQGLGRPAIGRLDLGQEGGAASLNLLLHSQEIGPEPVKILVEEGGGLRGAPCEQGDRPGDGGEPAPRPPRRHSEATA